MDEKRFRLMEAEREAVIQRLTEALEAEPSVLGAWLHGSFPEGRPFHDIDIAVYVSPDSPAAHSPLALMLDLGNRLERTVRLPVDV
ncbi:MAG: nucleotidyltransferase domain-containing protein, partial [Fimbriimonadales bacterium]|nr:nucleotidyltransferase domain-containing protein [Fimbriimonadales bacterium]